MEKHMLEAIYKNYNIGQINYIAKTLNGSGNTFIVYTDSCKYLIKRNERSDFVFIYYKIHKTLMANKLIYSEIIKTINGNLTQDGITLYSFLEGTSYKNLTETQARNAIEYMILYNKALLDINISENEIQKINNLDKARSLNFLVNKFMISINSSNIDKKIREILEQAIETLYYNIDFVSGLNTQLIHSDLGADNFLFNNNDVYAIIDFTPDIQNELYSLCNFVYWHYLWSAKKIEKDILNKFLDLYISEQYLNNNKQIYYLLLLQTSLYRIAGILLNMIDSNSVDSIKIRRHVEIVKQINEICCKHCRSGFLL